MLEKDRAILLLIADTIDKIFRFTSDLNDDKAFENDIESFDATVMNLIILGEAVGKLSENLKNNNPQIDWRKIYAFRNVLAHDYFGIYPAEVWEIVKTHLPELRADIENILSK